MLQQSIACRQHCRALSPSTAECGQAHRPSGNTIDGISANATPEELRAEIAKRVALLRDKGYVDLDALPAPAQSPGDFSSPGDGNDSSPGDKENE